MGGGGDRLVRLGAMRSERSRPAPGDMTARDSRCPTRPGREACAEWRCLVETLIATPRCSACRPVHVSLGRGGGRRPKPRGGMGYPSWIPLGRSVTTRSRSYRRRLASGTVCFSWRSRIDWMKAKTEMSRSSHAVTFDTLIYRQAGKALQMGTSLSTFGPEAPLASTFACRPLTEHRERPQCRLSLSYRLHPPGPTDSLWLLREGHPERLTGLRWAYVPPGDHRTLIARGRGLRRAPQGER
jgi:hypothetical protein